MAQAGGIYVHDGDRASSAASEALDEREGGLTQWTPPTGDEGDRRLHPGHRRRVRVEPPMRPATTLVLLLLLALIVGAGIVFIIQLVSVS